jgi:glyoxylase-like metal-dependent hydrolase (beta-lactamase superfamily II)
MRLHLPGTQPPWLTVLRRVAAVHGAAEIAPGVSTVPLPGHTPGAQGVRVETDAIAFDESFRRVESLGCEPIPSHDVRVLETRLFG